MLNAEERATGIGSELRAELTLFELGAKFANPRLAIYMQEDGDGNEEGKRERVAKLACCTVYGRNLFFLPLDRRESVCEENNREGVIENSHSLSSPFLIDLVAFGINGEVISHCFLYGHGQPALAVLFDNTGGVPIGD